MQGSMRRRLLAVTRRSELLGNQDFHGFSDFPEMNSNMCQD